MAAAMALFLELEVEETGEFSFDAGQLAVEETRENLVVRAFEKLHPSDGISFRMKSDIPVSRGLGSSAAAIVAGLCAADHLFELAVSKEELVGLAAEMEGHPDNVAAAIYGGFVICATGGEATPVIARFNPPEGLEAIVVIPPEGPSTKRARELIPKEIPVPDAVANISNAALLVLGLRSADLGLLSRGLSDRIHQERRRKIYPQSMEIVDSARELGALGATISGAGPTVLVWTTWQDAGNVAAALEERCAGWAEVKRLPFSPLGADVPEL
jgi:homoserine kinase